MSTELTEETTQIALHSVRNMLGDKSQQTLFSDQDREFSEEYGVQLEGRIERFGVDLTDTQARVLEGILYGFSTTSYKGNLEARTVEDVAKEDYKGKLPPTFKYLESLPRLRATQGEILEWAGIPKSSIAARVRALEALRDLGSKQYCFFYDRLAFDEKGVPVKDRAGKWKKEEVVAVDTLFTLKQVRDHASGNLNYYEITLSPLFLDQRESYFMLVPNNWREEVRLLYGNKKSSSYTFRLLLFLRYQYEVKRRSRNTQQPYQVRWSPEEIATAIKMSSSVIKRNRKRMNDLLEGAYEVAVKLGYLTDYERTGHLDVLTLNDDKYHGPQKLSVATDSQPGTLDSKGEEPSSDAKKLLELFHYCRRKRDPKYAPPSEKEVRAHTQTFDKLLKERTFIECSQLMEWSITKKFWCSRLSTPSRLLKYFSEAWTEMSFDSPSKRLEENRSLALELAKKCVPTNKQTQIEVLSKYVEVSVATFQPTCIEYTEPNFQEKLQEAFKKYQITIPQ